MLGQPIEILVPDDRREEHTDKATALRQWLHKGAELYALRLVSEGRISIGYAAEVLDRSSHQTVHRLLRATLWHTDSAQQLRAKGG